ncbi:MAG: hypothetical protein IPK16_20490 [Anaerolineales bacterium]|nr:hypothetical protein [Anaerolineales bacterium]
MAERWLSGAGARYHRAAHAAEPAGAILRGCAKELNSRSNMLDALKIPRRDNVDDNVAESFAVSYGMLDADLQAAFHALGQCAPSGAPVAGVAAMLEVDEYDARDLLRALAMVSLAEFDGERAELHPLLFEYAGVCAQSGRQSRCRRCRCGMWCTLLV